MLTWKESREKWSNGVVGYTGKIEFCRIFYDALRNRDSKEGSYKLVVVFTDEETHGESIKDLEPVAEEKFNEWLKKAGLVQE